MTNEEAIKILNTVLLFGECDCPKEEIEECLRIAIKALEQEPCEDAISRQALIERINNAEENFKSDNMESIASDDGDPFVDGVLSGVFNIRQMVMRAPSVNPKPKMGRWIEQIDHEENCRTLICSNCDRPALHDGDSIWKHKFCPHCGAKMESEVEE